MIYGFVTHFTFADQGGFKHLLGRRVRAAFCTFETPLDKNLCADSGWNLGHLFHSSHSLR